MLATRFRGVVERNMDMDESLEIRSGGIPRSSALLVTDEVDASGGWLIAHLLRRALGSAAAGSDAEADASRRVQEGGAASVSRRAPRRVCLVTAEHPASHYTKTLAKLGRDARADLASGRLVVVDLLSRPFDWCETHANTPDATETSRDLGSEIDRDLEPARALFVSVVRALEGEGCVEARLDDDDDADADADADDEAFFSKENQNDDARRVVIFDDVRSALALVPSRSLAAAVDGVLRSCVALRSCAVVAGAHADVAGRKGESPGGWLAAAAAIADTRVDVVALKTGVAEDVHGRVRVMHRTGKFARDAGLRHASAKYRLAETGIHVTRERSVAAERGGV